MALIALVVTGLIFSNSFAAKQVAADALVLDRAEAALGANDIALKSLSQALLLAEDRLLGVADASTANAALTEAGFAVSELQERTVSLLAELGSDPDLAATARRAVELGEEVVRLIGAGEVTDAGARLAEAGRERFARLQTVTRAHRDDAAAAVTNATALMSRIANLAAFVIAFLIPAAAILVYRRVARGQLRLAEVQLDARLEAERDLVRAKDEFVASISHELRTPLTSIYGFSELLIEQGIVDPEYSMELISMINSESSELHRMVEDLLASARHEAGSIHLAPRLLDLEAELRPAMLRSKGTAPVVDVSGVAWCDASRLEQILRNLLANARRFGGDRVRVTTRQHGDFVEVVVADDGPGVPPAKKARLFTRYVHEGEDPLTVGSIGLGLAVVRILAEAMGGSARYERVDGWSEFIVQLPTSETVARATRAAQNAGEGLAPHLAAMRQVPAPNRHGEGFTDEVA